MSSPVLVPDLEEVARLEADADRIFGEDSRSWRTVLGIALSELHDRGGPEATRAYLQRAIAIIRKIDLLDTPPGEGPQAS